MAKREVQLFYGIDFQTAIYLLFLGGKSQNKELQTRICIPVTAPSARLEQLLPKRLWTFLTRTFTI
jgi:hypothetical protein